MAHTHLPGHQIRQHPEASRLFSATQTKIFGLSQKFPKSCFGDHKMFLKVSWISSMNLSEPIPEMWIPSLSYKPRISHVMFVCSLNTPRVLHNINLRITLLINFLLGSLFLDFFLVQSMWGNMAENMILVFGKMFTKFCKSASMFWIESTPFTWMTSFEPTCMAIARGRMLCIAWNLISGCNWSQFIPGCSIHFTFWTFWAHKVHINHD